jgi:hypothetical protein
MPESVVLSWACHFILKTNLNVVLPLGNGGWQLGGKPARTKANANRNTKDNMYDFLCVARDNSLAFYDTR